MFVTKDSGKTSLALKTGIAYVRARLGCRDLCKIIS